MGDEDSAAGVASDSPSCVDKDCVHLTREQYSCIAEVGECSKFTGLPTPYYRRSTTLGRFPTWSEMMDGSSGGFEWPVHLGWLGSLKFGLLTKGLEGGGALYDKIFTIFETLSEEKVASGEFDKWSPKGCNYAAYHSYIMVQLCFKHLGGGWFKLHLERGKRAPRSVQDLVEGDESSSQYIRKLSAEAVCARRTLPSATSSLSMATTLAHLPGSEPEDSSEDQQEGIRSPSFHEELRRTFALVGQRLEEGGESVPWGVLCCDLRRASSYKRFLTAVGERLDRHIEEYGESLLQGMTD